MGPCSAAAGSGGDITIPQPRSQWYRQAGKQKTIYKTLKNSLQITPKGAKLVVRKEVKVKDENKLVKAAAVVTIVCVPLAVVISLLQLLVK